MSILDVDASLPLAAALAALIVKYLVIPLQARYAAGLAAVFPAAAKLYFDPLADHTPTLMGLSALCGYIVMAVCVCTLLDSIPRVTARHKEQGALSVFSKAHWLQATGVSLANLLLFSHAAIIPIWQLHRGVLRGGTPIVPADAPFSFPWASYWHLNP